MATLKDRLALLITADADQAVREIRKVGTVAERDLGNATTKAGKFSGAMQTMGLAGVSAGTAVTAGLAAAGAAVAKFAADGVSEFLSLSQQVRNFQRASGASTEDSSRFVAVLDDMNIAVETGQTAVFKLGRAVAAGGAGLRQHGIEVAKTAEGNTDLTETLLNVADAFAANPDPAKRAEIAAAAFGRQGLALIPILEKGRAGLAEFFEGAERHGQILSDEDQKNAEELRLALDELDDSISGLQRELTVGIVPAVTTFADGLSRVIELANKATGPIGGLGGILKNVAKEALGPFKHFLPVIDALSDKSEEAADETEELGGAIGKAGDAAGEAAGPLDSAAESIDAVGVNAKNAADAMELATKALDNQAKAAIASVDAGFAYEHALNKLEDAQAAYNVAVKGEPAKPADRKRQAEDAKALAEAQLKLNEETAKYGANSLQAAAAREALVAAQERSRESRGGGKGPGTAEERERALLELREAQVAVAEAAARKAGGTEADQYSVYRNKLIELKDMTAPGSELRKNLEALINTLRPPPSLFGALDELIAKLREARSLAPSDTGNILAGVRGGNTYITNNIPVTTNAKGEDIARAIAWQGRGWR